MKINTAKNIGYGLIALVVAFGLQHCQKPITIASYPALKEGENELINIDTKTNTIKQIIRSSGRGVEGAHDEKVKANVSKLPVGSRDIAITIGKDGKASITAKRSGFIVEPGVVLLSFSEKARIGLDVQLFYTGRYGLNTGLLSSIRGVFSPRAYVALSASVFHNTAFFVGVDNQKQLQIGVRVAL